MAQKRHIRTKTRGFENWRSPAASEAVLGKGEWSCPRRSHGFDSSVTHQILRDWQIWICTRLLSETKWVRFPHPAPIATKRRHSITDQCSELLPRTMRVQISLPLPMWGCRPTDEGARLRTGLRNMRSEFNSLHPLHISQARVSSTSTQRPDSRCGSSRPRASNPETTFCTVIQILLRRSNRNSRFEEMEP